MESPAALSPAAVPASSIPRLDPAIGPAAPSFARDRFIDLLRAVALVRVFFYHALGIGWITIAFPSMGIMFTVAGSLMALSLDRAPGWRVVGRRLRRLLLPLWLFAAFAIPAMWLYLGWPADDANQPTSPTMLNWLLPLTKPPANDAGQPITDPLWYISTYLWFVLLSPALRWLYRRAGALLVVAASLAVCLLQWGYLTVPKEVADSVLNLCTYLPFWLLGFALYDGFIGRLRARTVFAAAAVLAAAGAYFIWVDRASSAFDLTENPIANVLWSLAFVLVLLRLRPSMAWLRQLPVLDRLVTVINGRAVTIYLWHNMFLYGTGILVAELGLSEWPWGLSLFLSGAGFLVVVAVLLVGWVEDVAARRRPVRVPA